MFYGRVIYTMIDISKLSKKYSVRIFMMNPQSTHFWKKNDFDVISEADVNGWTKMVAERKLP